jgi:hypothetical protein
MATGERADQCDPVWMRERARALLGAVDLPEALRRQTALEEALRRAYARIADDLTVITAAHAAGTPPDLATLFGPLAHEKLGALLFVARHALIDLATVPAGCRDVARGHEDVALYAEVLFRARAFDGIAQLHDWATEAQGTGSPTFWTNVRRQTLLLLARMPDCEARLARFLHARPQALELVRTVPASASEEAVARLRAGSRRAMAGEAPAPPAYLRLARQYGEGCPVGGARGVALLLGAERRVREAFRAEDLPAVQAWFASGSAGAVCEVLRQARRELPLARLAALVDSLRLLPDVDPVRLATAVLALGAVNRAERAAGGQAQANRVLVECALAEDEREASLGVLAAQELASVRNEDALLFLLDRAPLLPVAETALFALKDLRRLLKAEPIVRRRPALYPAYHAAQAQLQELEGLIEAVWSCPNEEAADVYLDRLKSLDAGGELARLAELAHRDNRVFG